MGIFDPFGFPPLPIPLSHFPEMEKNGNEYAMPNNNRLAHSRNRTYGYRMICLAFICNKTKCIIFWPVCISISICALEFLLYFSGFVRLKRNAIEPILPYISYTASISAYYFCSPENQNINFQFTECQQR